jgi:hypothetical protein
VLHISIWWNEKPIYDVGDGIQSIIILTFPFFIVDSWVFFLEEPESNLHPWMQRKVIEVMESFPQHQYFITTHSNHFLDLTLDYNNISIYKFEWSEDKFTIEQVNWGNIATLKLLWVKNSSVFLSNCTIWIEGITDRLYIKKYLELYIASHPKAIGLVEDIDYSFVEYWGWNITHWSFLDDYSNYETIEVENLCGKLFLVIDNDDEWKAPKRKTALIDKLWDRFYELQCREIENSLPFDVIKSVVNHYEWEKAEFKELRSWSYPHKDEKIWEFIESRLLKSFKRKGGYKSESWTIVSKVQFCEKAQEFLNSYDALTPAAKDLIEKIYNFILSNK